jgi:hypothetical protein
MFPFRTKPKANPVAEFEAAVRKAISIAKLSGVPTAEMSAILSSWCVSWERQALQRREARNYATSGLHRSGNLP